MFQATLRNDTIMQHKPHLSASQNTSEQDIPSSNMFPISECDNSDNMRSNAQHLDTYSANSSGTTTPTSSRSSLSYGSNVSSTSTSSRPKVSSMKSSLKSTPSTAINLNRRSSPPTVRFTEPEPVPRAKQSPVQIQQRKNPQRNSMPNPLIRYQHRPGSSVSSSTSSQHSQGPSAYLTPSPCGVPAPQYRPIQHAKTRAGQRFSTPVQPSRPDPRWSGIPLPANFTPPSLALERRVSSFQSIASNLSVQSAPAALQTLPNASPPGQFNPLEHYIPCLHTACNTLYSPTNAGPTYYLPQGPYSLPLHRGYCHHHATKELRETNALCKRAWESLRQNAGRKTLGQIATEFDLFLESFRQDRRLEDAELQRRQKRIVLGTAQTTTQTRKGVDDAEWNWIYTPRHCTRSSCTSEPYSPFANHLYDFYTTPRPSTFAPLPTLCPSCAKNEVEAVEQMISQKWSSRCGWNVSEWNEWFEKKVEDRETERDFWEKAQERVVREKGPSRLVERMIQTQATEDSKMEKKIADKRKSVFKRLFGSMAKSE